MIEIDGTAGGQVLRTACALSAITKKPCRVFNVRNSRKKPGLMPQHLLGIQALAQLCKAKLEKSFLGSKEIEFYPEEIISKNLNIKIETAGSVTLCLQLILPVALFAPGPVKISFSGGGTDVPFSPNIDYFRRVFLKILEKMEIKIKINILKRGYYPAGGAKVEAEVFPFNFDYSLKTNSGPKLKPLNLTEKGKLKKILAVSTASEFLHEKKAAEKQISGIRGVLSSLKLPFEKIVEYSKTDSPGSAVCLIAEFENSILGSDGLGKLGKSAEETGRECALRLLAEEKSKSCLDRYLSDQILPFMALSGKKNEVTVSEITDHCKNNISVIEKFIEGNFKIERNLISWLPK